MRGSILVKAKIGNAEVEGEPEEIARLLRALQGNPSRSSVEQTSSLSKKELPKVERLAEYMKSKPQYVHSWDEIRGQFADATLTSRGKNANLYRLLYWRTQLARRRIEQAEGGKFKREDQTYKFEKG
jgi:hypothetical protein